MKLNKESGKILNGTLPISLTLATIGFYTLVFGGPLLPAIIIAVIAGLLTSLIDWSALKKWGSVMITILIWPIIVAVGLIISKQTIGMMDFIELWAVYPAALLVFLYIAEFVLQKEEEDEDFEKLEDFGDNPAASRRHRQKARRGRRNDDDELV